MSYYKGGKRTGKIWKDLIKLDEIIKDNEFQQNAYSEKDYQRWISGLITGNKKEFSTIIITETNKNTNMPGVYCFGKKHRADMSIGEDAIAIELKYIKNNVDDFKKAIGQLMIYRIKYKFAILIIILSDEQKELYNNIVKEKSERDFEELIKFLAKELNIYTYIIPEFKLKPGIPKIYTSFIKENFV